MASDPQNPTLCHLSAGTHTRMKWWAGMLMAACLHVNTDWSSKPRSQLQASGLGTPSNSIACWSQLWFMSSRRFCRSMSLTAPPLRCESSRLSLEGCSVYWQSPCCCWRCFGGPCRDGHTWPGCCLRVLVWQILGTACSAPFQSIPSQKPVNLSSADWCCGWSDAWLAKWPGRSWRGCSGPESPSSCLRTLSILRNSFTLIKQVD